MKIDFSITTYTQLLEAFITNGYNIIPFVDFIEKKPKNKTLILRHDVDKLPLNSLKTAQIENELGVSGTYYFRIVKESFDTKIIDKISALNHEIGYHYEDLTICKGNIEKAIKHFEISLQKFRNLTPVKTICMHGSPLSKWDNRDLWKNYNYNDFKIIAEPYFDVDFNNVLYLTDTGRNWKNNGSVRDRVNSTYNFQFNSTFEIIKALDGNLLPNQIMINFHPQRWTNNPALWCNEFVFQNTKNIIKNLIYKLKARKPM